MNFLKKILRSKLFIICAALLALYTLAGFFLTPMLVRHYVPKMAQEQLKKQAVIGKVRINPYVFTIEANDFRMEEPDGQLIAEFKRLFVDFELKSLFKWAWTFRQVSLEGPHVNAVIAKDGGLNLASLAPPSEAPPEPSEKDQAPPRLIIEDFVIDRGQIDFSDRRRMKPASITLQPLQLQIKNLATLPGQGGLKSITATLDDGGTLRWDGEISLNPVATKGSFAIENIQTATVWKFIRDALTLEQPTGKVGLSADYNVDLSGAQPQAAFDKLAVELSGLALTLEGAESPFFELPDARVTGGRLDFASQEVAIQKLEVAGGRARIFVDESGGLNLERIVRDAQQPPAHVPPPSATDGSAKPWTLDLAAFDLSGFAVDYQDRSRTPGVKADVGEIQVALKAQVETGERNNVVISDIGVDVSAVQAAQEGGAEPELQIQRIGLEGGAYDLTQKNLTVDKISLEGGAVDLKRLPNGSINLAQMFIPPQEDGIGKENEATAEGHPFQFLAKSIALTGFQLIFSDLTVKPDASIINLEDMAVSLANVDGKSPMTFDASLKVLQGGQIKASGKLDPSGPALESEVEVAELGLTSFQPYVSQAANIDLKSGKFSTHGKFSYGNKAAGARTAYKGGFKCDDTRATEAGENETLIGWKSVQTDQLTVHLEPNLLEIGDLKVLNPTGKFIIEKDHSTNMTRVIKPGPDVEKSEASPEAGSTGKEDGFSYRVRRILINGGEVDFADLSLITPFGTRIHELKGVVVDVSSVKSARAQVNLDGRVDDYGTAKIDGELDTSDPKEFTNISVVFRNVEMSRLTPYSGKFAGRRIDSGKLSADFKYKIDKSQLAGDNTLVLDRLTLGEKVESPEATNLPLDLAIALLKDSEGVIDLGLPVSGNLDSPEFSYGALIWKALVNLLTKIVTSPFLALGALLPDGGEEGLDFIAFEAGRSDVPPPEKEKLAKLAEALQKRPQLKLGVQGRYNSATDLSELKSAGVRRALATRLGQKLDMEQYPGVVDYSSPETVNALEAMFSDRFGADALAALKAEQEAALEKSQKDASTAKTTTSAPTAATEDPEQFAKNLFTQLAEAEPVDEAALVTLAEARGQAIVAELTTVGQIPLERIEVKPSAADDEKDSVSAALSLEAGL